MATITGRIRELLANHEPDAPWRERAVALASGTTRRRAFEQHSMLRRLRELDAGWLDKPRDQRVDALYPALRGVPLCASIELQLANEDELDQSGPYSDFDPLNSVYVACIPMMSVWYSLLCLPGESISRWPVVRCDPSAGDESVVTVAVNFEHFIHQWMCRDSPEFGNPLVERPEAVARDIIAVMGAVFGISTREATAAWQFERERSSQDEPIPTPASLAPYVDPDKLRVLDRLAVLP